MPNCKGWIGGTGDGAPPDEEDQESESDLEDEPEPILLESDGCALSCLLYAAPGPPMSCSGTQIRPELDVEKRVHN